MFMSSEDIPVSYPISDKLRQIGTIQFSVTNHIRHPHEYPAIIFAFELAVEWIPICFLFQRGKSCPNISLNPMPQPCQLNKEPKIETSTFLPIPSLTPNRTPF